MLTFIHPWQKGIDPSFKAILDGLGMPLNITSGHRPADYNRAVGGAPNSSHIHGTAVDVDLTGLTDEQRTALVNKAFEAGVMRAGAYSDKANMLHLDMNDKFGPGYRMFDKSNKNMGSAPAWFRGAAPAQQATVQQQEVPMTPQSFGTYPEPGMAQQLAANPFLMAGLGILGNNGNLGGAAIGLRSAAAASAEYQKSKLAYDLQLANAANKLRKPTSVEQQLQAAGLVPGSPQYQQAILRHLFTPKSSVTVNNAPASAVPLAEPGFVGWVNPKDATKGYRYKDPQNPQAAEEIRYMPGSSATAPTAGESKQDAQFESAKAMAQKIEQLITTEQADIAGWQGLLKGLAAEPNVLGNIVANGMEIAGFKPSSADSLALVLSNKLEKELIAAMRGAAVGPAEEEAFRKSLPVPGMQPDALKISLAATIKNLDYLHQQMLHNRDANKPAPAGVDYSLPAEAGQVDPRAAQRERYGYPGQ